MGALVVHLKNEMPGGVELADFGEDVDEDVVGGSGEGVEGEGFGVVKEGEGDFGVVGEAKEGLVEEVSGEGDGVELER